MRNILLVILVLASLGFHVESPEALQQRRSDARQWAREISQRYDLRALHRFLDAQIQMLGCVDGVALRNSKLARKWTSQGSSLVSGTWQFTTDPSSDQFRLSWLYDEICTQDGGKLIRSIVIQCQRVTKTDFRVLDALKEEDEVVVLSP